MRKHTLWFHWSDSLLDSVIFRLIKWIHRKEIVYMNWVIGDILPIAYFSNTVDNFFSLSVQIRQETVRYTCWNEWTIFGFFYHTEHHQSLLKELETTEIYWVTFHFAVYGFTGSIGFTKFCIYVVFNFKLKMWKLLLTVLDIYAIDNINFLYDWKQLLINVSKE